MYVTVVTVIMVTCVGVNDMYVSIYGMAAFKGGRAREVLFPHPPP